MDMTSLILDALCRRDPVLARRLDLLRLIEDKGPIDAETILSSLGRGRFGARPSQAIARDLRFLRDAGIDIRYQVSLTTELRLHPELTLEEARRRVARKFAGLPEVLL